MKYTTTQEGDFTVIAMEGRLDTTNYVVFETGINNLMGEKAVNLVLDCTKLEYVSSSGLRVFLNMQKKSMAAGGKLHFCCLLPEIREIFSITGFTSIFKIFDTKDAALKA